MKPVKILFFIENLSGGGAEKVLCNLVNEMDQSKFNITVQTLWKVDADKYLLPGIRYRYCYPSRSAMRVNLSRLEAATGLTYPLHIKDDYDVEVAYLECGATKIIAGSTNTKAKKIAWVHCDLSKKISDLNAFCAKAGKWYQKFDQIACVSRNVQESFTRLFDYSEKTQVLYNTIDDAAIRKKAQARIDGLPPKKRITAVSVGRLTSQKAYDRLLRVHKALTDAGCAYDLWILGEGEKRAELETYISRNQMSDSVQLLGFHDNPYPFMQEADFLVCSSLYEGFSTFVSEGVILGKPIVTTDCTGMRELLGDSQYGLITENTEHALFQGMRNMIENPELRDRYAKAAAIRGQSFSARLLTEQTENCILRLVSGE